MANLPCVFVVVWIFSSPCMCGVLNNITTTPPPTTTPRGSPQDCLYEGKWYRNGETISEAADKCYGSYCSMGGVLMWDDKCFLSDPPPCAGYQEKLTTECCPVCHTTTTPPTTHPPTPTGACVVNGKIYHDGQKISEAPDHCYGEICQNGDRIVWDHECAFVTPQCNGRLEKLADQCCPVCHSISTTTPPPSMYGANNSSPSAVTLHALTIPVMAWIAVGSLASR